MFKGKKVLVTGSEGMIGRELVLLLEQEGAEVFKFDILRAWTNGWKEEGAYEREPLDITNYELVKSVFETFQPEFVFNLFGIKGSPKMTSEKPASFMMPMLQGDTNIIRACQEFGVSQMLYTSSIAVLNPQTDKYPAWAKQTAETLIDAMRIQYPEGTKYCIVRPANVYGRFDNFNNPNAMVITSLINKAMTDETFEVWGDGSEERDVINARDVARGMMLTMKAMPSVPINLCQGKARKIKDIVEIIEFYTGSKATYNIKKKTGDKRRVMSSNGKLIGFKPEISLKDGLKEVIGWQPKK